MKHTNENFTPGKSRFNNVHASRNHSQGLGHEKTYTIEASMTRQSNDSTIQIFTLQKRLFIPLNQERSSQPDFLFVL